MIAYSLTRDVKRLLCMSEALYRRCSSHTIVKLPHADHFSARDVTLVTKWLLHGLGFLAGY